MKKANSLIGSQICVTITDGKIRPKEIKEVCDCNSIVILANKDNLTLWVGTCSNCGKTIKIGDITNVR